MLINFSGGWVQNVYVKACCSQHQLALLRVMLRAASWALLWSLAGEPERCAKQGMQADADKIQPSGAVC